MRGGANFPLRLAHSLFWAKDVKRFGMHVNRYGVAELARGPVPGLSQSSEVPRFGGRCVELESTALWLPMGRWVRGAYSSLTESYAMVRYGLGWMSPSEYADFCQKSAHEGQPSFQYKLGVTCLLGDPSHRDPLKAFEWFQKAASQGHSAAQYRLGCMLYEGLSCGRDLPRAIELMKQAAAGQNIRAVNWLRARSKEVVRGHL